MGMDRKPPIAERYWKKIPAVVQTVLRLLLRKLYQKIEALQQNVESLGRKLQVLTQENRELRQRIAALEAQRKQNSTNSSRPPSSDGPHVKRKPPVPRSGKKKGGQPGHRRHTRPLAPPEKVQEFIPCKPTACARCDEPLHGDDPAPKRHQVWEIPPLEPQITEYQIHSLCCPCCGTTTRGELPPEAPRGQFGPRLISLVALLTGAYRLSKRQIQTLCQDLLGLHLSTGQICRLQTQTHQVLQPVVDEARRYVQSQHVNLDETSWRENRRKCWLWVAVTTWVVVFFLRPHRSAKVRQEILGASYAHVVTSDRAKAYEGLPLRQRQICWSHLRRDFQAMIDRGGAGKKIGERLLFQADLMLEAWAQVRAGQHTRSWIQGFLKQVIRHDVGLLLEKGAACSCAKTAATCRDLLAHEEALWTFAYVEGVEPTNNAGEREFHGPVILRKTSFGTDSELGSRFVETIFTVTATCRRQRRHVWDYLTACHRAHLSGQPLPSLLPSASTIASQ